MLVDGNGSQHAEGRKPTKLAEVTILGCPSNIANSEGMLQQRKALPVMAEGTSKPCHIDIGSSLPVPPIPTIVLCTNSPMSV